MAAIGLFDKQADVYANARPSYPPSLFSFLSSLTPTHHLAWDVGTGNGQAALALAKHYGHVIATDISSEQLKHAAKLPNISYRCTSPNMSLQELHDMVGPEGSVDIVTVAQALHWFDLNVFYSHVKHVLRKPGGVLAAWCYIEPLVNPSVDSVFHSFYRTAFPNFESAREIVDDEYRSIEFPFIPVLEDGRETGPISFETTKDMTLHQYFAYIQSWSALQTARRKGIELFTHDVQNAIKNAWGDPEEVKTVRFPLFMRLGTLPL